MVRLRTGTQEDTGIEGLGRPLHSYFLLEVRLVSISANSLLEAWTGIGWVGM